MQRRPRLLVLGGSGQLGQAITRDREAVNFEIFAPPSSEIDVRDSTALLSIIGDVRPDRVINCAAFTAVDRAETERDRAFAINAEGARNVAMACDRSAVYLIHISTDYVFDGESDRPYREDDVAKPINVYGESKLLGEQYVALNAPNSCVLRVSWLFGSSPSSFVAKIVARAQRHEPLRVVDDQLGCPTSTAGLAAALMRIVQERDLPTGSFHFCGQPTTTWFGFAAEIVRQAYDSGVLESKVEVAPISSSELESPTRRPKYSVLDAAKIEARLRIGRDRWLDRLPQVLRHA